MGGTKSKPMFEQVIVHLTGAPQDPLRLTDQVAEALYREGLDTAADVFAECALRRDCDDALYALINKFVTVI